MKQNFFVVVVNVNVAVFVFFRQKDRYVLREHDHVESRVVLPTGNPLRPSQTAWRGAFRRPGVPNDPVKWQEVDGDVA